MGNIKKWLSAIAIVIVVVLLAFSNESVQEAFTEFTFNLRYGKDARVTQEEEERDIKPHIYDSARRYLDRNLPDLFDNNNGPVIQLVLHDYPGGNAVKFSGEFYDNPQLLMSILEDNDDPDTENVRKQLDNGKEALFEAAEVTITADVVTMKNLHFSYDFVVPVYVYHQFPLRAEDYVGPYKHSYVKMDPDALDKLDIQVCRTPEIYRIFKDYSMEDMLDYREYMYTEEFDEQADEAAKKILDKLLEE